MDPIIWTINKAPAFYIKDINVLKICPNDGGLFFMRKNNNYSYFLAEHRGRHLEQNKSDIDYESMSDKEKNHYLEMENAIFKKKQKLWGCSNK